LLDQFPKQIPLGNESGQAVTVDHVMAYCHQLFLDVFTCTSEIVLTIFVLPHEGHLLFSLIRLSYSESDQIFSKALSHFSQRNS
jgi:hypothetical protein